MNKNTFRWVVTLIAVVVFLLGGSVQSAHAGMLCFKSYPDGTFFYQAPQPGDVCYVHTDYSGQTFGSASQADHSGMIIMPFQPNNEQIPGILDRLR